MYIDVAAAVVMEMAAVVTEMADVVTTFSSTLRQHSQVFPRDLVIYTFHWVKSVLLHWQGFERRNKVNLSSR